MKKIYFLSMVVLLLFQVMFNPNLFFENKQLAVFVEEKQLEKNRYYLSFEKENCTSLSLEDYFVGYDVEIKTVYPKNHLMIEDEKIDQQLSSFPYSNQETLQTQYLTILEKYGLYDDMEKTKLYGIVIDKAEIKISYQTLKSLLQKFPNLEYSYQKDGKYQS